ncbi:MAG TPA: efflux RND transporter periplasmic adaptor subunit [Gemmatirosa sp.]|nr:efflux RND transporter periplasmic adaptor subunit [Gemmatirosa sp.]
MSTHPLAPRRGRLAAAALLVGATSLAAASCGGNSASAASDSARAVAQQPVSVGPENVAVVQRDTVQSGPALSGSLQPERQATLRAEVPGTVNAALAEPGQRVARGAVLARIETTGIADQAIAARGAVATAQAQFEVAQRNAERSERLLAAGAIAETQAEQARTGLTAARSQLQAARAQQAQASRQLGSATVTAPFAGIVGSRAVSTGDVVNVGTQLYTVVDPSSMQLEGSVPADQLSQVRVGAPVRFSVTGYPDRAFTGRITRVAPIADPTTRQVQIIASIPNVGNQLVGGLFAEGRVASETRDALVVPLDAVDQRGVRPSVVRVKAGKAERVPVELGLRDEARETVELRTGVAQGDTLLRGAAQGISAGSAVRVAAANDRPATQQAAAPK